MRASIFHMINDYIENTVDAEVSVDQDYEDWDLIELNRVIGAVIPMAPVTPDDVKAVAGPVMAHRVVLSYGQNRYADALRLIEEILNTVPAPTEDFSIS